MPRLPDQFQGAPTRNDCGTRVFVTKTRGMLDKKKPPTQKEAVTRSTAGKISSTPFQFSASRQLSTPDHFHHVLDGASSGRRS